MFNAPFGCTIHSHISAWSRSEPITGRQLDALAKRQEYLGLDVQEFSKASIAVLMEAELRPSEWKTKAAGMVLMGFWWDATPEQRRMAIEAGCLLEASA